MDCEHWALKIEDVVRGNTICPDCGEDLKAEREAGRGKEKS